jgi:hypothetical protein
MKITEFVRGFQVEQARLANVQMRRAIRKAHSRLNRSRNWPLARTYGEAREAALRVALCQYETPR